MRILVVEDEADLNLLLCKVLTKAGYTVDGCLDGEDAQAHLLGAAYDGILLDVMLPKKDGYTLVQELRDQGNDTPVLFLTARDSVADRVKGLDLGGDDYLVKPFAASRFQQALDTFCQHREAVSHDNVSQQELDALFPSAAPAVSIPKGLQTRTLDRIRACLRQSPQAGATCETIADCSGFSTVTVRRYLTYLVSQGEAVTQVNYDTGGRPCMLYRLPLP